MVSILVAAELLLVVTVPESVVKFAARDAEAVRVDEPTVSILVAND
jgi:hypothetical protein